jgi:hypothetical protein
MKKAAIIMTLILSASSAFADQCLVVTKGQAEQAVAIIKTAKTMQNFCELCGDLAAQDFGPYETLEIKENASQNTAEVVVDDQAIDLAYTYVDGLNLANLVGCSAMGVSDSIK